MDQLKPLSDSSWVGLDSYPHSGNPSPSPIVITTGADLDYAALLSAIPGFQGYQGPTSTSSNVDHTLQAAHARDEFRLQEPSATYVAANFGSSEDGMISAGANSLVNALPELNKISRQRSNLLALELQIECVQKKLKILRQELTETIEKDTRQIDLVEMQTLTPTFHVRQSLRHVRELLDEMAREEEELEPLQQELTTAQYTVKEAEDQLYATLTGGAKPGDSDASAEDRMFTEAVLRVTGGSIYADSDVDSKDPFNDPSPLKTYKHPEIQPNLPLVVSESGFQRSARIAIDDDGRPNSIPELNTARRSSTELPRNPSKNRLLVSPAKQKISIATDLTSMGSQFHNVNVNLAKIINHANKDEQLIVSPLLAEVRKRDLKVALGFDLTRINRSLVLTEQQEKDVRAGVAQKLTNINRQVILHRKQHVSLWLRDMSQNSASESMRTFLYGHEFLNQLVSRGKIRPLDHIIHDIRSLEVPFDAEHEADSRPLIVGHRRGPSSSIIAQPSSKDAYAYHYYKHLFYRQN